MTEIKRRGSRQLTKKQQREVLKELQAMAQRYDVPLSSIYGVIDRVVNSTNLRSFRIPEENKLKHTIPQVMTDYILSIPDLYSYRACDVRDMVIEKFPDSGIKPSKIYLACYYLMNKDTFRYYNDKWRQNNKEAYLEKGRASHERKKRIYKELKEANK